MKVIKYLEIILLFILINVLSSCSKTEFAIKPIPNAVMYSGKDKFEYFDVSGCDELNNQEMLEKLKLHTLETLDVDSVKAYNYQLRIYYKHSNFSKYNTSLGAKWDKEGIRDSDSPDLFDVGDRRIGLVRINNAGAKFKFLSYINTSIPDHEEIDSTFILKMSKYKK